jgi:hypothetical protein
MVEASHPWLPDVPATTTPCLATCFSKLAESYYDENKRLIPWSIEGECAKQIAEFINRALTWKVEEKKAA